MCRLLCLCPFFSHWSPPRALVGQVRAIISRMGDVIDMRINRVRWRCSAISSNIRVVPEDVSR